MLAPRLLLLFALGALMMVSPACEPDPGDDPPTFFVQAQRTWPLVNVSEGQTDFEATSVELRGVHWSHIDNPRVDAVHDGLSWVALLRDDLTPHPFRLEVVRRESGTLRVHPLGGGFRANSGYFLVFPECDFMEHIVCPPPVWFSTASAPRVTGLWRNEDTLLVVFSETMNEGSLYLGHGSVDLVFEEGGVTRSVVTDMNVADFVWDTEGRMFMVAPISEIPFSLVFGPQVRATSGKRLDVDRDGRADEHVGSFVHRVYPTTLPVCYTRADFPDPCIELDRVPDETISFEAPFRVELDVP